MRVLAGAFAAVILLGGFARAEITQITVTTGEYPPFTGQSLDGNGSVNEVVARLAEEADLDLTFEYLPWKRALEVVRKGKFTASSFWFYSEDRQEDFYHVGPIMNDKLVFFRRTDLNVEEWGELSDLSEYNFGAVTGYTYSPEFWELSATGVLNVEEASTDEANLRKLLAGRIDMFPMSELVGYHLIGQLFSAEEAAMLTIEERPLQISEGFLLVSRAIANADQLAKSLQQAVDLIEPVKGAQQHADAAAD